MLSEETSAVRRFVLSAGVGALLLLVLIAAPAALAQEATPARAASPAASAAPGTTTATTTVPVYDYRVANTYRHDRAAFTQGLVFVDGELYEGTGLEGESGLRRVELETGKVLQSRPLDPSLFGEGIAVLGDRIYQLTWKNQTAFVYDRETFDPIDTFDYPTEGWGLTTDGERLIMSDGTSDLVFRDPGTFAEIGRVEVRYEGTPLPNLNELEFIDGEVWANVWRSDFVVRIDPATGDVTGVIDLRGLLPAADAGRRPVDVLNGIAHDPATGRIFVTGKLWPRLFEIELVPRG